MALRQTLLNAVDTAFEALGDLVVDVTLTSSASTPYDFASGTTGTGNPVTTLTVRGVLLTETKRSVDGNRAVNTLILKAADVGEVDAYDSFTIGTKTYGLQSYSNNGFAVEIILSGS